MFHARFCMILANVGCLPEYEGTKESRRIYKKINILDKRALYLLRMNYLAQNPAVLTKFSHLQKNIEWRESK
jgi:hypothetical protein